MLAKRQLKYTKETLKYNSERAEIALQLAENEIIMAEAKDQRRLATLDYDFDSLKP